MLWKGAYPFEYKDEKFNKISLPEGDFYSHLNIEDITDTDYKYSKRVYVFVCSKWYIIVSWYIGELSKYGSWNVWACSWKISLSSWIRKASSFKKD